MAEKTERQRADALGYPDEGFYEGPDDFGGGGDDDGWSDEHAAIARGPQGPRSGSPRGRAGEAPYGIVGTGFSA